MCWDIDKTSATYFDHERTITRWMMALYINDGVQNYPGERGRLETGQYMTLLNIVLRPAWTINQS